MYIFDNITITPNNDGFIISNGTDSTQVFTTDEVIYEVPYEHQDWELLSDDEILERTKRAKIISLASKCTTHEQIELVASKDFDGLMQSFQEQYIKTTTSDNPVSGLVIKIENELMVAYNTRLERYHKQLASERKRKAYNRKKVSFTVGNDHTIRSYTCGETSKARALEVGLSILYDLSTLDEYDGLDTLAKAMNFMTDFGYDCNNQQVGVPIVESLVTLSKAMGFSIPASNRHVQEWTSNGVGDGDEELIKQGLLPSH